ncbi:MAG TPA: type II toxin-antitoxin system VapC family toxin [Treponemataceae bacterium]|nr:type II toxin-antitoxin system VapC family toxin [Treponemataceae bacterium]
MKTIALDTCEYAAFKRGDATAIDRIARADLIVVPLPVLAELRVGFRGGIREKQNLEELERFLSSPRVEVPPMTEQTAILYAEIFGTLKRKGSPIPINDVWIAAVALERGAILFSRDAHFSQIEGLPLNLAL